MKTYLVTGAAGFIGARFLESLKAKGIQAISVDSLAHFRDRTEHQGIETGQIIDRDALFAQLSKLPPITAVVHLGACSNTMEMNVDYFNRVNVEYSKKLWEYCTEKMIPFVYASSAATYGDGENGYSDDESQIGKLKPLNPYGTSKQIFDLWVLEQEKIGSQPPVWSGFKFFNVYGFGERHKEFTGASVIMHAYDQIMKTGRVKLFRSHREGYKDGEQKRDFIAVEDVIDVLHYTIEKPIRRGIFNLGTGHAQTFLDLARSVFSALGKKPEIDFIDTPVSIRDKYQYFTEAKMEKLRAEGYAKQFLSLAEGSALYVKRLQKLRT
jgi:ADP-L-glycero-D-manno-heptose 6-epimerase